MHVYALGAKHWQGSLNISYWPSTFSFHCLAIKECQPRCQSWWTNFTPSSDMKPLSNFKFSINIHKTVDVFPALLVFAWACVLQLALKLLSRIHRCTNTSHVNDLWEMVKEQNVILEQEKPALLSWTSVFQCCCWLIAVVWWDIHACYWCNLSPVIRLFLFVPM